MDIYIYPTFGPPSRSEILYYHIVKVKFEHINFIFPNISYLSNNGGSYILDERM